MILAGDMTPVISSRKSVAIDMNHMAAILSSFFPDVAYKCIEVIAAMVLSIPHTK